MSVNRIAPLITKLFGIALLVYAVEYFVGNLRSIIDTSTWQIPIDTTVINRRIFIAQTLCFYFIASMGTAFFFWNERITAWIIKDDVAEPELPQKNITKLPFAVVGALIICLALPDVVEAVIKLSIASKNNVPLVDPTYLADLWAYLIGRLVQLGLGLFLFLGAAKITRYWQGVPP